MNHKLLDSIKYNVYIVESFYVVLYLLELCDDNRPSVLEIYYAFHHSQKILSMKGRK